MKFSFSLVVSLAMGVALNAQLNVDFISNLDYDPILNDIWGYVDNEGTEYALVGMTSGLSIVSLADPADPKEVQFIPGTNSTWRDIKTWGDFAYVVADQGQDGLLIIDLSALPGDTAQYAFWTPDIPDLGVFKKSHNIFIDEYGLAYLAGSNIGGTVILDVKPDPWNPTVVVKMPLDYAHDVYARDSLVYTSEIYLGELRIYDISNIADIRLLGMTKTPNEFTHNAWLSDDGNTIFTTDERANAFIGSYDVSDPANIRELDRFRPAATQGLNVIPHNVHVFDDYLIISYYTDGCIIVDASRPDNLIEVGNFDTYPESHGGFNGSWGAYPWLPSGNILMSDRQHGLFVLGPHYLRGCYLEGNVVDDVTQLAVANAQIEILLEPGDDTEVLLPVPSDAAGVFKTGKAVSGTYRVRCTHPDYYPAEGEYVFENGVVTQVTFVLTPKPKFQFTGRVIEEGSAAVVPFANVAIQGEFYLYQTQADQDGLFMFPAALEDSYKVYAGNWGQYRIFNIDLLGDLNEDIPVRHGYYDDFLYNYGWMEESTSTGATWVRATPKSGLLFGEYQCNPAADVDTDFGTLAYVTGNLGGSSVNDAVRDGETVLSSPMMDLTSYTKPMMQFQPWLCQRFTDENVYFILLSNGMDTVVLDTIRYDDIAGNWDHVNFYELTDVISITDQMQVHFRVTESPDNDNFVKGGLDVFTIFDEVQTSVFDFAGAAPLRLYPNPVSSILNIDLTDLGEVTQLEVLDLLGRKVTGQSVQGAFERIDVSQLGSGVYVLVALGPQGMMGVGKVVVE